MVTRLEQYCDQINQLAETYLQTIRKSKSCVARFFNVKSYEERTIESLQTAIDSITCQMAYPHLSFFEENQFLNKINHFYEKIVGLILLKMSGNSLGADLKNFFLNFTRKTQKLLRTFFGVHCKYNFSLFYLKNYLTEREVGYCKSTHYSILKAETMSALKNYLTANPNSKIKNLLLEIIDSIKHDYRSINCYTRNPSQRFDNLLEFLNRLRLVLMEKKDNNLLLIVTRIMDKALGIIRLDSSRFESVQRVLIMNRRDPIENCLLRQARQETRIISRSYNINLGMFSVKSIQGCKIIPSVNDANFSMRYLR